MESEFHHEYAQIWGWLEDGSVEGYLIGWVVFEEFHIANLAVSPDFRRRGVARALVEHALDWAKAEGAEQALLEVRASNEAAQRLYRSLGFDLISIRKDYYIHPTEDAWVFLMNLGA